MSTPSAFARHLTDLFLFGDWSREAMESAARAVVGGGPAAPVTALVRDVWRRTETPYAPPPRKLARYIRESDAFEPLYGIAVKRGAPAAPRLTAANAMAPLAVFEDSGVPELVTPGALADWLSLSPARLNWFADIACRLAHAADDRLRHYDVFWSPKRAGPPRLIEAPKSHMKVIQRKILRDILDRVSPHDAAHGFRRRRSCIGYAQPHAGERVIVAVDLKEFFVSVPLARVHGLFRCLGYPWSVARLLTGLCSAAAPRAVFAALPKTARHDRATRSLYLGPHLPQGAPTSPALANLCAWRMDHRLNGLARHLEARYTRYADDLAFSGGGDFANRVGPLLGFVEGIVKEEGFLLNQRKTRVMSRGQRQTLTGLVVNQHVNIPRAKFDTLKATLHNCMRFGPEGQNHDGHADFRGHLNGRITWIENVNFPRGQKLRALFDRIDWTPAPKAG